MIIGLREPGDGRVFYNGRTVIDDLPEFQSRIGCVPRVPAACRALARHGALHHGRQDRRASAPFPLDDDRHCPLSAYSKGMRQKIPLSAALMHNLEVLILDEPLSGSMWAP